VDEERLPELSEGTGELTSVDGTGPVSVEVAEDAVGVLVAKYGYIEYTNFCQSLMYFQRPANSSEERIRYMRYFG